MFYWLIKKGAIAVAETLTVRSIPLALNREVALLELSAIYAVIKKTKQNVESYFNSPPTQAIPPKKPTVCPVDTADYDSVIIVQDDNIFNGGSSLTLPEEIQKTIDSSKNNIICIINTDQIPEPPQAEQASFLSRTYDTFARFIALDIPESAGSILGGTAAASQFAARGGLAAFIATPAMLALPAEILAELGIVYLGQLTAGTASKWVIGDNLLLPALKSGKQYLFNESTSDEQKTEEIELDDFSPAFKTNVTSSNKKIEVLEEDHFKPKATSHPYCPQYNHAKTTPTSNDEEWIDVKKPKKCKID